jgi:hypothetical protein
MKEDEMGDGCGTYEGEEEIHAGSS